MAVFERRRAPIIFVLEPFGGSIRRNNPNLPFIFWDDAAVTRGDGVFESLLVRDAQPVNVERHAARFRASAQALGLPEPDADYWVRATAEACEAWAQERGAEWEAKCTWTYTRGRASTGWPSAWLVLADVDPTVAVLRERGVQVLSTPRAMLVDPHCPEWARPSAKTLNYAATMTALRYARDHGLDDVIFVDPEHAHPEKGPRVLEGATSSVIVAKTKHRLRTPPSGGDVLHGTTQAAIFEHAEKAGWRCKERDLYLKDLRTADSVWLVSSVRGPCRVLSIDGKALSPGEETAQVRAIFDTALGTAAR